MQRVDTVNIFEMNQEKTLTKTLHSGWTANGKIKLPVRLFRRARYQT